MDLSKTILIIALIVNILLGQALAAGESYFSGNIGCENNTLKLGGGRVLISKNKPLKVGMPVQFINVGPNGKPDRPSAYLAVGEDDTIVKESTVGGDNAWMSFTDKPGLFFDSIAGKANGEASVKVYARAWGSETRYGDSEMVTLRTNRMIMPLPEDIALKTFYVDKTIK